MAKAKRPGEGTLLQVHDGGDPGTYSTVANRIQIDGPEVQIETVDETDLDSQVVEGRPDTIPDMGTLSLSQFFDPEDTGDQILEDLAWSPEKRLWRLVFNNGTTTRPHRQFLGHLTKHKTTGMEKGSDVKAELEIKIDGPITRGTTTIS